MKPNRQKVPLDDIEFLARSGHRVTALVALSRRPQSRADLLAITGVSQSTMGRTLREFEDRNWIRRNGSVYEASLAGEFVASGMQELVDRIHTEQMLRDSWELLPDKENGFTFEMVADAVVTVADIEDPYRPVNRFLELLRDTDRFRFAGFNAALLEPCKDQLCQLVIDGMQTEIIDPPNVIQYIRSTCPNQFSEMLESGDLTLRVHDELPTYGIGLFDNRTAITGYDPSTGMVKMLVDTDAPEAREWAESVYETYCRKVPTIPLETPAT